MADDRDEPLPSGWLPPRPPVHFPQPGVPPRAPGAWPRDPYAPSEPSSPMAIVAIALGALSLLLLVFSIGVAFFVCGMFSAIALALATRVRRTIAATGRGRAGQAKAALVVAFIGLGLAFVAGVTWTILSETGFTPQDLQQELERQRDRLARPR